MGEKMKEVALRVAREMGLRLQHACGCSGCRERDDPPIIQEFATRLIAELQKDVEPCAVFGDHYITPEGTTEAFVWTNREIAPGTKLYTHPQPKAATVPEGWKLGVEAVAKMLEKKADDYALEYGYSDMGSVSFGRGPKAELMQDYHSGLLELAEEVRAMLEAAPSLPAAQSEGEQK